MGNVVLVVIQYRLGLMGFFSYKDEEKIIGNFGLYDQIFALEWVQRNIQHFNGDPNKVTIFGESAGVCSNEPSSKAEVYSQHGVLKLRQTGRKQSIAIAKN